MKIASLLFIFFLIASCNPSSEREFRSAGKKIVNEISAILRNVENHEELQASVPRLKKKFNQLADLLIEVRTFQDQRSENCFSNEPLEGSEVLFTELARLYEIPGCREIIEQAQVEAVYKLLPREGKSFKEAAFL